MATKDVYSACPIKRRKRRGRAEIERIKRAIYEFAKREKPVTVRQVFYHLTTLGLIGKTENEYQQTVVRLMAQMRRERLLPFAWVSDATRWMRRPDLYSGLDEALERTRDFYRRDLWESQDVHVEIWLEKEALSGVVYRATAGYGVALMPCKGYPSLTFVQSSAEVLEAVGKPAFVYYLGDADPSGRDIPRWVESQLREFAPSADITFEVAAVTDEQIVEFDLPSRPTKRSDSRAKNWLGDSVELDAIPPAQLRELVAGLIVQHIDADSWNALSLVEEQERQTLASMAATLGGSGDE